MFQRGRYTTNQMIIGIVAVVSSFTAMLCALNEQSSRPWILDDEFGD